jgi:chondroitin 4-sulfotransferase 11
MSIYHKWNTVFVQIPKNASSSIHKVLENQTDREHDHRTYIDILSQNDPELIESYFSFAVVRNPYDRFVSAYEYLRGISEDGWNPSFEDVVNDFYSRGTYFYTSEEQVHWWPQHVFVGIKNIILVDKILRYENVNSEWSEIATKIINGLPESYSKPTLTLPHENTSHLRNKKDYKKYYTKDLAQKIYELYKKDFEMFGYDKEL